MDQLLLVDGSNLLFQMFFGMPARIVNKKGKAVQGTLGFVGALIKIVRMINPTHIAVLFDGDHANDRAALDSDYKANRIDYSKVPAQESPFSQLPDIYDSLDYLGIRRAETTVCETDDWIAAYVKEYGSEIKIVISSLDSDYFQLLNERVSVLRYRGVKTTLCTPDYIRERLGIEPRQYADFKSLVGDPSDNIKGAEKIGEKTAASLLKEFKTLDEIVKNADKIKKTSVRDSVVKNADKLQTNYKLIKLDGAASLPFPLQKLSVPSALYERATTEVLKGIELLP